MADWIPGLSSAIHVEQQRACGSALKFYRPLLDACVQQPPITDIVAVRKLAREYGGAVTTALKALSTLLPTSQAANRPDPSSAATHAHAMLAEVACASLDGLDCLRPALKTKGLELEMQRYGFVRRFTSAGLHHHALSQGWKLRGFLQQAARGDASSSSGTGTGADLLELQSATTLSLLTSLSEALSWPAEDERSPMVGKDPLAMLSGILSDLGESQSQALLFPHLMKVGVVTGRCP